MLKKTLLHVMLLTLVSVPGLPSAVAIPWRVQGKDVSAVDGFTTRLAIHKENVTADFWGK